MSFQCGIKTSEGVMGTDTMGRVTVTAKIENSGDLSLARKGFCR